MSRQSSFYYSFLSLPAPRREAIIAVWDFCHAVDDAVDEAPGGDDGGRAALDRWRAELDRCFAGRGPETPEGRALQPLIARFHLPRAAFEEVLDGVGMDIEPRRFATFAELEPYCLRVASAVGLIAIEIFGYRNPQSREYARHLGIALQLTNIVRDLRADHGHGRVYLPMEDLERFDCRESDLGRSSPTPAVRALVRFECERAEQYYCLATRMLPPEDRRTLVAAEIMRAIYHDLLCEIRRRDGDVFAQRVRVSRPRQAWLAARTWLATRREGAR